MTLKKGNTGYEVRELQRRLKELGHQIEVDGWFGDETEKAVIDFQKKNNLTAIGEVGPRTEFALKGYGNTKTLSESDLNKAAELLGVPVAAVATVAQVESSGHGFDATNKSAILFERHVFYRQLIANGKKESDVSTMSERMPNIINKKRGGYVGGSGEQGRFSSACQIDETSDLRAQQFDAPAVAPRLDLVVAEVLRVFPGAKIVDIKNQVAFRRCEQAEIQQMAVSAGLNPQSRGRR